MLIRKVLVSKNRRASCESREEFMMERMGQVGCPPARVLIFLVFGIHAYMGLSIIGRCLGDAS